MALPYVPTTWKSGDLVSSTRLNKLEGGVKENSDAIVTNSGDISRLKSQISGVPNFQSIESFVKGGMNAAMTSTNTNANRARVAASQMPLIPDGYAVKITAPANYEFRAAVYDSQSFSSIVEILVGKNFTAGTVTIPQKYNGEKYLGVLCRKADNSDFTDEEIAALPSLFKFEIESVIGDATDFVGLTIADSINSTGVKHKHKYSYYRWSQGTIDTSTGENTSHLNVCRSSAYLKFPSAINGVVTFHCDSAFQMRLYEYATNDPDGFVKLYTQYNDSGTFKLTINQNHYYRLCVRNNGAEGKISPSDIPDDAIYWEYESYSEKKDIEPSTTSTYPWSIFSVKTNLDWPDVSATSTDNAETETEQTVNCALVLPSTYSASGKPTPLIMFGHGSNGAVSKGSWYQNGANFITLIKAFQAAGYAVFDVDNTRANANGFADWGCLPLMTAYVKAWEYIKEHYNVEQRLFIYSDSMGTVANLNMMKWYSSEIIASIQAAPRPFCQARLEKYIEDGQTDSVNEFLAAFGMSSTDWESRLDSFNHYENMKTINEVGYVFEKFPPLKVMVGTADTLLLTEVREYYTALANFGNFVNYREVTGADHGTMCFLSSGSLTEEAIAWFARFRQDE